MTYLQMQQVIPFCISGGHAYEVPTGTIQEGAGLPEGWAMTRASLIDGEWVRDDESPAKICHCEEHAPRSVSSNSTKSG